MRVIGLFLIFLSALAELSMAAPADLSLRLLVDNPRPFVGEEFSVDLEFGYRRLPPKNLSVEWSGLNDSIVTDLPSRPARRDRLNGQTHMIETARKLLRPLYPVKMELSVTLHGGEEERSATPLTIRPQPLPNRNRPKDFSGAVVREARLKMIAAGDGEREVLVTLSGQGHLNAVALTPRLQRGDHLIALGDELTGRKGRDQTRRWRYLYQPAAANRQPDFSADIFDPVDIEYRTLTTSAHPVLATNYSALVGAAALLIAAVLGVCYHRRKSRNLNDLLTRMLGATPQGMTHARFASEADKCGISPELIDALLDWHRYNEERFAPGDETGATGPPPNSAELACKLAMEIDKRRRLP